jgi:hypothetical protein
VCNRPDIHSIVCNRPDIHSHEPAHVFFVSKPKHLIKPLMKETDFIVLLTHNDVDWRHDLHDDTMEPEG